MEARMRMFPGSALLVGLVWTAGPAPAADRDAALAVVEQAIKAHGGDTRLARAQQMTRTGTGTLATVGKETPFSEELTLSLPDRYRHSVDLGPNAQTKTRVVVVLAKDKGGQQAGGMTLEVGPERLEELRGDAYLLWLTTLVPLAKDDGLTLAPQPDDRVGKAPAAVIKVSRKGQPDVRMFFDKASGLLVKTERRTREAASEFVQEHYYTEHKDFDGVKLPTQVIEMRSGQKFVQLTGLSYKFLGSVDDGHFGK